MPYEWSSSFTVYADYGWTHVLTEAQCDRLQKLVGRWMAENGFDNMDIVVTIAQQTAPID